MRVHKKLSQGTLTVSMSGVLRASPRSIEVFQQLVSAIGADVRRVELDLREVLFVDSLWIGFLVTLSARCRELGVVLTIPRVSKQVLHALEETNVVRALPPIGQNVGNSAANT